MPTTEIVKLFSEGKTQEKLLLQLALQCAPLLKGVKAANIILLSAQQTRELFRLLHGSRISVKVLCRRQKKLVLYLYRKESLRRELETPAVNQALRLFGYRGDSVSEYLEELSIHTAKAYEETGTCPHEIGLFLGYPVDDVLGFVEHRGANYLLSGYWKVYTDLKGARRIFAEYTNAKEIAVQQVFEGRSLREIIVA